jgi:hypothetical protein
MQPAIAASRSSWLRWPVPKSAKYRSAANSHSILFNHDKYVGKNTSAISLSTHRTGYVVAVDSR